MSLKIYKYQIEITDEQVIKRPQIERVLSVQVTGHLQQPVIWMLVDKDTEELERLRIQVIGTGNPISGEPYPNYLGTFQKSFDNGSLFVGHVFYQIVG